MMTCTTTATKELPQILLPCPKCGEDSVNIKISLEFLHDDDSQFTCGSCEAEFGRNQIRNLIRRWTKVLAWLELAPDVESDEQA